MKLKYLLAAVSPLALVMAFAVPGTAQAVDESQKVTTDVNLKKDIDVDADVDYDNKIDVELIKSIDVEKDVDIDANIDITGNFTVDGWAGATIDGKQFINDNEVKLEGDVKNELSSDKSVIDDVDGNVGVNIALGVNNAQGNEVAIAVVSDSAAGLEAEVFKFQEVLNNSYDTDGEGISNTLKITDAVITEVDGNVGLNIALGAFNTQENALAIAVSGVRAADASLAEATVGVLQEVSFNTTEWDAHNKIDVDGPFVTKSDGNIGLNIALGVGNAQINTLAVTAVDSN